METRSNKHSSKHDDDARLRAYRVKYGLRKGGISRKDDPGYDDPNWLFWGKPLSEPTKQPQLRAKIVPRVNPLDEEERQVKDGVRHRVVLKAGITQYPPDEEKTGMFLKGGVIAKVHQVIRMSYNDNGEEKDRDVAYRVRSENLGPPEDRSENLGPPEDRPLITIPRKFLVSAKVDFEELGWRKDPKELTPDMTSGRDTECLNPDKLRSTKPLLRDYLSYLQGMSELLWVHGMTRTGEDCADVTPRVPEAESVIPLGEGCEEESVLKKYMREIDAHHEEDDPERIKEDDAGETNEPTRSKLAQVNIEAIQYADLLPLIITMVRYQEFSRIEHAWTGGWSPWWALNWLHRIRLRDWLLSDLHASLKAAMSGGLLDAFLKCLESSYVISSIRRCCAGGTSQVSPHAQKGGIDGTQNPDSDAPDDSKANSRGGSRGGSRRNSVKKASPELSSKPAGGAVESLEESIERKIQEFKKDRLELANERDKLDKTERELANRQRQLLQDVVAQDSTEKNRVLEIFDSLR